MHLKLSLYRNSTIRTSKPENISSFSPLYLSGTELLWSPWTSKHQALLPALSCGQHLSGSSHWSWLFQRQCSPTFTPSTSHPLMRASSPAPLIPMLGNCIPRSTQWPPSSFSTSFPCWSYLFIIPSSPTAWWLAPPTCLWKGPCMQGDRPVSMFSWNQIACFCLLQHIYLPCEPFLYLQ